MKLIVQLQDIQRAMKMTDRQFAEHLNTSAGLWCNIRQGNRPMSLKFLRSILNSFPTFESDVLDYIRTSEDTELAEPELAETVAV